MILRLTSKPPPWRGWGGSTTCSSDECRAPARPTTQYSGADQVFEVQLSATPTFRWRIAFRRPPPQLVDSGFTLSLDCVEVHGAAVQFRTSRDELHAWLRRIDTWIAYANSVVEE